MTIVTSDPNLAVQGSPMVADYLEYKVRTLPHVLHGLVLGHVALSWLVFIILVVF